MISLLILVGAEDFNTKASDMMFPLCICDRTCKKGSYTCIQFFDFEDV